MCGEQVLFGARVGKEGSTRRISSVLMSRTTNLESRRGKSLNTTVRPMLIVDRLCLVSEFGNELRTLDQA